MVNSLFIISDRHPCYIINVLSDFYQRSRVINLYDVFYYPFFWGGIKTFSVLKVWCKPLSGCNNCKEKFCDKPLWPRCKERGLKSGMREYPNKDPVDLTTSETIRYVTWIVFVRRKLIFTLLGPRSTLSFVVRSLTLNHGVKGVDMVYWVSSPVRPPPRRVVGTIHSEFEFTCRTLSWKGFHELCLCASVGLTRRNTIKRRKF